MSLRQKIPRLFVLCLLASPAALGAPPEAGSTLTTQAAGTWALGADGGFGNPLGDSEFDAEPLLDGYAEYFFTPHVSLRGGVSMFSFGGPEPPPFGGPDRAEVDVFVLSAQVLYQWAGRSAHPFIAGGVGLYDYEPDIGEDDLAPGFSFGGGANFFLSRRFGIKLEGMFHGTGGPEPDSFFNLTVGARWLVGAGS